MLAQVLVTLGACREAARPASLRISVPYQIDTLDPHAKDRLGNVVVASHFYDALVTMDAEMSLQRRLALRWETPDPVTWILHLRSGVRFHDGHPFTADDVVFTLERLRRDPALECGVYASQISGVRALDEMTVELKTSRPTAVLLNKLTKVFIVARGSGALDGVENGTGPYRLVERSADRIVMRADGAAWGPRPEAAGVTFLLARGAEDAARDLVRGRAELAQCSSRAALRILGERSGLRIARRTELFTKMLGFGLVDGRTPDAPAPRSPFLVPGVREAVSLAIDRRTLVTQLSSHAVPAGQLVPATIFGYDPSLAEPRYDLERARRLLADAGYPDGFDATLHTRRRFVEGARRTAALLAPVGIRAKVQELSDAEFFELGSRHRLPFFLLSFGCGSGDISDLLDAAFHTPERHFGTSNFAGFSDRAVDDAIEKSALIPDAAMRKQALRPLVRRLAGENVLVPLYVDEVVFAAASPWTFSPRADSFLLAQEVSRSTRD